MTTHLELEEKWEGILASRGRIAPDYGGFCSSAIPGAVRRFLGGRTADSFAGRLLSSRQGERILLVVLDGLGYNALRRAGRRLPFLAGCLEDGDLLPVTTVFPSTTSAAMTTLHSGKLPGEHGLIEWYLYIQEIEMLLESLPFSPLLPSDRERFDREERSPKLLYDGRTVYSKLSADGIPSAVLQPDSIAGSIFTKLITKGADTGGYDSLPSALAMLEDMMAGGRHGFIHFYYPGIDTAGHIYGPSSAEYMEEMRKMDAFLASLSASAARHRTTIVMTSDHGQVDVRPDEALMLNDLKGFDGKLAKDSYGPVQPYGSSRDVILKAGEDQQDFAGWLRDGLGARADVLMSGELAKEGFFGSSISARARSRMGDIWILPRGTGNVWYRHYAGESFRFLGVHGGMTGGEMIVPLLIR